MKAVTVAGGSSDDPEIEQGTTVPETEPDVAPDSRGAEQAQANTPRPRADSPKAAPKAGAEAEADPAVQSGAEAGDESGAGAGAGGKTEAGARAEAGAGGKTEAEAEAGVEGMAQAHDHVEAGAAGEPAPEGAAAPEADAEPAAKVEGEVEPVADAEAKAGPEVDAAGEAATGPATQPVPEAKASTEAGAEPQANTEAESEVEAAGEATTGPATQAAPEAEAGAEPEAEAAPENEAKAGPGTPAEPEADAAAEPVAGAKADTEAGTKPRAEAVRDATTRLTNKATPAAHPKAGANAENRAEPQADAAAQPAAGAKADTEAGAKPRAEVVGDAASGPAHQATPAAHPEAEAEVGAEPEGEAGAEATQVIVAPRPRRVPSGGDGAGSPRVPAWARADADAEQTSEFVALKDLDVPPPAAPEAKPRVQSRPPEAPAQPLPALDLLAELTNTPPPPETPRRTALRRVKVWTPILLVLAGAYVAAQMLRPLPAPQMVSTETTRTVDGQFSVPWPAKGQGAVLLSGSGEVGTFGEQKPVPTASVAKVMTAYVILKGHPLRMADPGPDITVDAKTVSDGKAENESRIVGLTAGQKFSQQDMLKMLMIPSGNNVARMLARWDTGTDSEAAFVAKMNAAAKELGMTNTTYTDPSGLDAGTVSTAADQLKLAEAVMKDEVFRSIVALPNAPIKGLSTPLDNNNDLLNSSIRGIKTGSSTPAGGALMWAAYKTVDNKDQLILGTLMDQHVDGPDLNGGNSLILVQDNSKKIIEAVRGALASAPVIRKGQQVGYLDDGLGGRMPLVATKDLKVIGVPGQQLKLSLTPGASPLPHTAKAGTEVATLTVGEGDGAKSVPVAVEKDMAEPSFGTRMTRMR
ncbi:serine hydrolase [Streptomyces sp. DSM 41634]|uniref:serine hydrolase n=1 Tax=Streptomyces sp. DSM 41634 TaxID=3448656 RepID=UPI002885F801|nr:serine hydrolase [Streptomyces sp. DSM 41633]